MNVLMMMLRVTALQIKYGVSNCLLSRALVGQNRIQNQCKRKFFELYLTKTEYKRENTLTLNQHESTRAGRGHMTRVFL